MSRRSAAPSAGENRMLPFAPFARPMMSPAEAPRSENETDCPLRGSSE
jgi:hypothetical protein